VEPEQLAGLSVEYVESANGLPHLPEERINVLGAARPL
jgi:hypothetical protein